MITLLFFSFLFLGRVPVAVVYFMARLLPVFSQGKKKKKVKKREIPI
jgi:hypothetical protein